MMAPRIVFRTDASLSIGTGHVMRCLSLADALQKRGAVCHFICRSHPGHLIDHILACGHTVTALPQTEMGFTETTPVHAFWLGTDWRNDARETRAVLQGQRTDWLVIDHYALDARWESEVRPACERLLVIDDLADRPHDCDLLLDQNLGRAVQDYAAWVPASCKVLAGPQHALLRTDFSDWRDRIQARRATAQLQRLLITLGGVDKDNATSQVLKVLCDCALPEDCKITVVMGPKAPWLADVRLHAAKMPWPTDVRVDVRNMAQLMAESDLCIGAAGSTNWERCCMGLPCLLLVLADNQQSSAKALAQARAVQVVAFSSIAVSLPAHIKALASGNSLAQMSAAAFAITDGLGAPQLAQQMLASRVPSRDTELAMAGGTF
jgi:UDP-2,4-diacetamido-2,4,6-trideoxy-beta-L-altropyranose hydrolase